MERLSLRHIRLTLQEAVGRAALRAHLNDEAFSLLDSDLRVGNGAVSKRMGFV